MPGSASRPEMHPGWAQLAQPENDTLAWRRAACRDPAACAPSEVERGGLLKLLQSEDAPCRLAVPPGTRGALNAYINSTAELAAAHKLADLERRKGKLEAQYTLLTELLPKKKRNNDHFTVTGRGEVKNVGLSEQHTSIRASRPLPRPSASGSRTTTPPRPTRRSRPSTTATSGCCR